LKELIEYHGHYPGDNIERFEEVHKVVEKQNQLGKNLFEDHKVQRDNYNLFERRVALAFVVDDGYDSINDVRVRFVVMVLLYVDRVGNYESPTLKTKK
jgi:hypothetical protein